MPDGICGKSAAPYVLIPRPLFNRNKVLGASDSPRWGASQSGFGHGHAIDTSSRTDPQRGRCEYEVESLLWQSSLLVPDFARFRKTDADSTISQPRYGRNQPPPNHEPTIPRVESESHTISTQPSYISDSPTPTDTQKQFNLNHKKSGASNLPRLFYFARFPTTIKWGSRQMCRVVSFSGVGGEGRWRRLPRGLLRQAFRIAWRDVA